MGVYKCPVCEGRGFVYNGFYQTLQDYYTSSSTATETCRTCGGKGIVWDAEMFQGNVSNRQYNGPDYCMTFQCKGTCSNCEHNDRMVYTSNPVKYKCTLNNDWHEADYRCEHWAEQQMKYFTGTESTYDPKLVLERYEFTDDGVSSQQVRYESCDDAFEPKLNATGTEGSKISNITKSNKCAGCTYDGECDSLECHKGIGCANYDNVSSLG